MADTVMHAQPTLTKTENSNKNDVFPSVYERRYYFWIASSYINTQSLCLFK